MNILAGTGRGVFLLGDDGVRCVLESRGVRDLVQVKGRIFAATGAGLFASDDSGRTWRASGLTDFEVWQIRGNGSGLLYAGTQPAALFVSADAGATWRELESFRNAPEALSWCIPVDPPLPGRARAIVVDRENPELLWVGVEVGGVMCSEDGGATWSLRLPGDNPDLHMMWAHPTRPATLFASTGYGRLDGVAEMIEGNAGVFRSDDHGNTWRYVWKGITPRYSRPMCVHPLLPDALTVASAPTAFSSCRDENGAGAMLFRSEDGGESWRSFCDPAHSPSWANIHGLAPDPEVPGGVLTGTDTGEVWRISNEAEWTLLGEGMPVVLSLAAFS